MSEFSFDDVKRGVEIARADGARPTQLHLGGEEVQDILMDSSMKYANNLAQSPNVGVIAGLDVQEANATGMRVLLAQDGDHVQYHIL